MKIEEQNTADASPHSASFEDQSPSGDAQFRLVGAAAWVIGAFILLDWNWQAAIGFALVKFGACAITHKNPKD